MRKFILLLIVLVFSYSAYSQCTPDANLTHSGFYPNPLPDGKVGVAYNQNITFQFPLDTNIVIFGTSQAIHIDSVIIQSVNGFPASYTKTCDASNCKYFGTSLRGCMKISGTPTAADTGTKKLVITVMLKIKLSGVPLPYPLTDSSQTYRVAPANVGLNRGAVASYSFGIDQITPNPFTEKTVVTISSPKNDKMVVIIRDILGKEVYRNEVSCKAGINYATINTEDFKAGYYLLSVNSASGVITRKITKR